MGTYDPLYPIDAGGYPERPRGGDLLTDLLTCTSGLRRRRPRNTRPSEFRGDDARSLDGVLERECDRGRERERLRDRLGDAD